MNERFLFDALSAIVLLAVATGGAYLPRYLMLKNRNAIGERSLIFTLGNMLSGGVMLSAGFCHLLAESLPAIQAKVKKFPLATFLCAAGYVLTLVADEIAVAVSGQESTKPQTEKNSDPQKQQDEKKIEVFEVETAGLFIQHEKPKSHAQHTHAIPPRVSFITAVLLGAALSLHSVLEGLALGSQSTLHSSEDIMLAIFAHKGLAAYALGASLMDSQTTPKRYWSVVLGFAIASPIGILIGYGVSSIASGLVSSSLSALASGTFLYVATMEVIPKELADPSNKIEKISAMLVGFSAMSVLAIWA